MTEQKQSSTLAITSLVFTILWVVTLFTIIFSFLAPFLLLVWLILWIIAIVKKQKLGMSITSTVISWILLAIIIWLIVRSVNNLKAPLMNFVDWINYKMESNPELWVILESQNPVFETIWQSNMENSLKEYYSNLDSSDFNLAEVLDTTVNTMLDEIDNSYEQYLEFNNISTDVIQDTNTAISWTNI